MTKLYALTQPKLSHFFSLCILFLSYNIQKISAQENLEFASIFGDGMVMQQEVSAPVWGTAEPNSSVEISSSWASKKYQTTANEQGHWIIKIPTPKTKGNKSHFLKAQSNGKIKTISNILLGEVWICSGQSNMQWKMRGFGVKHFAEDVEKANHPSIRLCQIDRAIAFSPQIELNASWSNCSPKTVLNFSAVAYFFGSALHKELDVPIGLISTNWGGSSAEAWVNEKILREQFPEFNASLDTYTEITKNHGDVTRGTKKPPTGISQRSPSVLYNGMISPLVPFAIKGVIWYQGESNTQKPFQYKKLFPALIKNWRSEWAQGDFPFYYVQIAPYQYKGLAHSAAYLREAQMHTLSEPHTGMAITMDIGQVDNIHPKEKKPVGQRLALLALSRTYGKTFEVDSGPIYKAHKIHNNTIQIEFDHASNGLQSNDGEILKHFTIAGADKKFIPAEATIKNDKVIVTSSTITNPVAVRYAWGSADSTNLENKSHLPASSFRTDDWTE